MVAFIGSIFKPPIDFYELLKNQAAKTLEGVETLNAWFLSGSDELVQRIKVLEKEADELKLDLEHKLVESFITPLDREDIYDLSVSLDEVINATKATVREIQALEVATNDEFMQQMSEILKEGMRCLYLAFAALKHDTKEAANQAFLSRKQENRVTKVYREAMKELFKLDDLKSILRIKEVYKQILLTADKLDVTGAKLLHVIMKIN